MVTPLRLMLAISLVCIVSAASADEAVRQTQSLLKQMGYYHGTVDGEMGSQTGAAIRRYQLARKLQVTGELNQQTLSSLGVKTPTNSATPEQRTAPAVPEYVALAEIFKDGPYISISPEFQIDTVRRAQKNLHTLGYYQGPVDGKPSSALRASLRAWQKEARLSQTGRFDKNTLQGLDLMPGELRQ